MSKAYTQSWAQRLQSPSSTTPSPSPAATSSPSPDDFPTPPAVPTKLTPKAPSSKPPTPSKPSPSPFPYSSSPSPPSSSPSFPSSSPSPSSTRTLLNYFLTHLRGHLVLAQLRDASVYEGVFHTADVQADAVYVILKQAQAQTPAFSSSSSSPRLPPSSSARNCSPFVERKRLLLSELVQMKAIDLDFSAHSTSATTSSTHPSSSSSSHRSARGFATDVEISAREYGERELTRWDGGESALGGLEDGVGGGGLGSAARGWDQFVVHERMTGLVSGFHFDDYSTPLDRQSAHYRDNLAKAERIAREIDKAQSGGNMHVMMERGQLKEGELDEDAAFSTVLDEARGKDGHTGYVIPALRKGAGKERGSSVTDASKTRDKRAGERPAMVEVDHKEPDQTVERPTSSTAGAPQGPSPAAGSAAVVPEAKEAEPAVDEEKKASVTRKETEGKEQQSSPLAARVHAHVHVAATPTAEEEATLQPVTSQPASASSSVSAPSSASFKLALSASPSSSSSAASSPSSVAAAASSASSASSSLSSSSSSAAVADTATSSNSSTASTSSSSSTSSASATSAAPPAVASSSVAEKPKAPSKLNPHAKAFSLSAAAKEFVPSSSSTMTTLAAPSPSPPQPQQPAPLLPHHPHHGVGPVLSPNLLSSYPTPFHPSQPPLPTPFHSLLPPPPSALHPFPSNSSLLSNPPRAVPPTQMLPLSHPGLLQLPAGAGGLQQQQQQQQPALFPQQGYAMAGAGGLGMMSGGMNGGMYGQQQQQQQQGYGGGGFSLQQMQGGGGAAVRGGGGMSPAQLHSQQSLLQAGMQQLMQQQQTMTAADPRFFHLMQLQHTLTPQQQQQQAQLQAAMFAQQQRGVGGGGGGPILYHPNSLQNPQLQLFAQHNTPGGSAGGAGGPPH